MARTLATLFSGGGGFDAGAKDAGYTPLWGVEYDPAIAAHYESVIGAHCIRADVGGVDYATLPRPDHLHASPSCKRASVANSGATETEEDREAARAVIRAIAALQPEVFTLENVRAYAGFESYALIVSALTRAGYGITAAVLDSADYGVPQNRERLILRAVRGQDRPLLPTPTHRAPAHIPSESQLGLFADMPLNLQPWAGWFGAIEDLIADLPDSALAPWQAKRVNLDQLTESVLIDCQDNGGGRLTIKSAGEPAYTLTATQSKRPARAVMLTTQNNAWGDGMRRGDEPAFTMSATQGIKTRVIVQTVKRLNPLALARLQSFPRWYRLPDSAKLATTIIGNAVPSLMARRICEV